MLEINSTLRRISRSYAILKVIFNLIIQHIAICMDYMKLTFMKKKSTFNLIRISDKHCIGRFEFALLKTELTLFISLSRLCFRTDAQATLAV